MKCLSWKILSNEKSSRIALRCWRNAGFLKTLLKGGLHAHRDVAPLEYKMLNPLHFSEIQEILLFLYAQSDTLIKTHVTRLVVSKFMSIESYL